jgi:hypothetical protein
MRPVVRPRARLHPDHARRQPGDQLVQLFARHRRANQFGLARLVHPVHRKDVLGQINTDGQNPHGLPLPNELMRNRT